MQQRPDFDPFESASNLSNATRLDPTGFGGPYAGEIAKRAGDACALRVVDQQEVVQPGIGGFGEFFVAVVIPDLRLNLRRRPDPLGRFTAYLKTQRFRK